METSEAMEDLRVFCRVCLQLPEESQLLDLSLIYDEEEQLSYHDCFTICTRIDLAESEELPRNLCKSCGLELQMAYDFKKKVNISNAFLQHFLMQQESLIAAEDDAEEEVTETSCVLVKDEELEMPLAELETSPATEAGMTEENLDASTIECSDELEEHLDFDEEYRAIEELDDEDAETVQIKIDTKSEGESEYVIEALALNAEELVEQQLLCNMKSNSSCSSAITESSWHQAHQAVGTVASKSHLPVESSEERFVYYSDDVVEEEEPEQEPEDEPVQEPEPTVAIAMEPICSSTISSNVIAEDGTPRKRYSGKFSCDYCKKLFPNHSRMIIHRRSHEADRPKFPCPQCARIYATKQAMEVHLRTVHTKTAGYACPICNKIYAIKKGMEVHMRYHTGTFPYVCDLCGKKFAQMCHLKTHKNVKHNSVRYCCEHPNCGKFFTSSASLRNHEFSHGDMPFECEFCKRGYPAKAKLKVHIRRKHGKEMTLEQLEEMRKFHVIRAKLNLIKVVECED